MSWSGSRDQEGHRNYTVRHLVKAAKTDGPANVIQTAGLPQIGSYWFFNDDIDVWAFCLPTTSVNPIETKGPTTTWSVENTFSTNIPNKRCQDTSIEDPLLEPDIVSGSFTRERREAIVDKDGVFLVSSSHEKLTGPEVEFDFSNAVVFIEQNVIDLQLPLVTELINNVNNHTLWGLPARTVKFSEFRWERKLFGTCYYYYTRSMAFEIDFNTWDRDIMDKGTKVLNGSWDEDDNWVLKGTPDKDNPKDFIRATDTNRNTLSIIALDGSGEPATTAYTKTLQVYPEANLFQLGIPATL